jgi:hypothetical protein
MASRSPHQDREATRRLASIEESSNGLSSLEESATLKNRTVDHRSKTIEVQLKNLPGLNRSELQRLWRDAYGLEPPEKISPQLMRQAIAHRLQVKQFGGLNFSTRRALMRLLDQPRPTGLRQPNRKVVSNGTVLVREWHGATHQVTAMEKGVLYRGKLFHSLSEVAREITGTRWSGPLFFGLRASPRESTHGTK